MFSKDMVDVIGSIEVDIDHPIEKEGPAPLVVYYGEKGERLWDIARKYSTSVSSIKQINDMSRDILEDKKLLLISR
ncbi:MAG: LysM peptidoglycan-binding domain-containing protein [Clostridia bacterium]|nr:LysM peptidoglycan-binding domain-containing protein [Clostridia bacterium]